MTPLTYLGFHPVFVTPALVPSVSLWIADRITIEQAVQPSSGQCPAGPAASGLPGAEAAFFPPGTPSSVQGLPALRRTIDRWA